jgi:hypothetical protein
MLTFVAAHRIMTQALLLLLLLLLLPEAWETSQTCYCYPLAMIRTTIPFYFP